MVTVKTLKRRRWILAAGLAALLCACGSNTAPPAIDPGFDLEASVKAWSQADSPGERKRVWEAFLDRNPSNAYTPVGLEYLAEEIYYKDMGDPAGGAEAIKRQIPKLGDPALVRQSEKTLVKMLGLAGRKDELAGLVAKWETAGRLGRADLSLVAGAAAKAGAWDLAMRCATAELAELEKLKRELGNGAGGSSFTDREKAVALMNLGWAAANSGDPGEGVALLERASELGQYILAGFPTWPTDDLDRYLAGALLLNGDAGRAVERILPSAVIGGDAAAMRMLREAWIKDGGDPTRFGDFVAEAKDRVARSIPEFSAFSYDGSEVRFDEVKGAVTFLGFWFPT